MYLQGPGFHPTDVGHIKVAAHLMQYIRLKFGWDFAVTGPEVQHGKCIPHSLNIVHLLILWYLSKRLIGTMVSCICPFRGEYGVISRNIG